MSATLHCPETQFHCSMLLILGNQCLDHRGGHAQGLARQILFTQDVERIGVLRDIIGTWGADRLGPGGLEIIEILRACEMDQIVRQLGPEVALVAGKRAGDDTRSPSLLPERICEPVPDLVSCSSLFPVRCPSLAAQVLAVRALFS